MNGQGKLLTHYLKNADKLIIPVYQRNYDWREEHCRKLYQDLVRTIRDRKRWHFFGGIVSVSDPMGSSSDYLVIDGQQRITTVSLLLLAMANLIKEGKVIPEDDDLYAQITKKYLVDEINPRKRKVKLKPIKGDQDAYDRLWGDPADFDRSSNITQMVMVLLSMISSPEKSAAFLWRIFQLLMLSMRDSRLEPTMEKGSRSKRNPSFGSRSIQGRIHIPLAIISVTLSIGLLMRLPEVKIASCW